VYAGLDPAEQRRADLHGWVDEVCNIEPRARLDAESVGFPTDYRAKDGSRSTDEGALNGVELAATRPDPSVDWLAELTEAVTALKRVVRLGLFHWPHPLTAGTVVLDGGEEVTVGQRGNTVAVCAWCGDPAPSGRDANGKTLVRRIGDHAVHATCYMPAYREAGKTGATIVGVLAARSAGRRAS
jgi:hypothetical protein